MRKNKIYICIPLQEAEDLTLCCPHLYSYHIGIPLFETRLMSPLGHKRVKSCIILLNQKYIFLALEQLLVNKITDHIYLRLRMKLNSFIR